MQKDNKFYRESVKTYEVAIAWLAFIVCDREIVVEAIKHPKGFRFLAEEWRSDYWIAQEVFSFI